MNDNFKVPLLFLNFNRPERTIQVFNEIKKIKPQRLYIAADGPRDNNINDKKNCQEVKDIIINNIEWSCEVKTLFREKNLGCKYAPGSAIDWFFQNEEMGIILEDDCVPSQSFFYFCEQLLEKYRNDTRIMMISGDNFLNGIKKEEASYYFSKFSMTWGWASWKRAWKYYDIDMKNFPEFIKEKKLMDIFSEKYIQQYFKSKFEDTYNKKVDTWDYQWCYTMFSQNGLCIVPNVNLVTNIGFGIDATHTKSKKYFFNLKRKEINNIVHPLFIIPDKSADKYTFHKVHSNIFRIFAKTLLKKLYIIQ